MNPILRTLQRIFGARAGVAPSSTSGIPSSGGARSPASSAAELLEGARALAREKRWKEASDLLWKVKKSQHTAETLSEHAEILLHGIGDAFAAASRASWALEIEPENARALAVRRELLRREDAVKP